MEQQSAAALEGGIASATPALIFQPTSAPAPRDSQLDSALLQARRSLTPDESLFVKLDKALQRECPHARDLVLGLLSKEVDAAYIRVADNIKRFKALLEEYADLNNSEEMWALRRLLPELNSSDIHTLEQLSQTIHKHADRITTCIESEDYGSLKQFAQLVLKNAKKFQDKYASIQPRLKELSEKFKELEARFCHGKLRAREHARRAQRKLNCWRAVKGFLEQLDAPLGFGVVAVGCLSGAGIILLLALGAICSGLSTVVFAVGGAAGLSTIASVALFCAEPSKEVGAVALASGTTAVVASGLGQALAAAATAMVALVPGLQVVVWGSLIALAVFVLGFGSREALGAILEWLWGAELRHHERAEQAFMKMEEVLHDLSGRLDGAADHLSRLLEATQTVRDTAEDMAREAEDGEDLKDPGGQVASDAQSEINAVLAQLAVDLQERATDLSKRVGESREPFSRLERRSGHEALLPPPRS